MINIDIRIVADRSIITIINAPLIEGKPLGLSISFILLQTYDRRQMPDARRQMSDDEARDRNQIVICY